MPRASEKQTNGPRKLSRKEPPTGRMKYMKDIPRKAKNGFRSGTVPKPKARKTS